MSDHPPNPLPAAELAEIVEGDAGTELAASALRELVERASGGSCMYTLAQVRKMGWVPPGLVGLSKDEACQVLGWGDFSGCSAAQQQLFARLAERLGVIPAVALAAVVVEQPPDGQGAGGDETSPVVEVGDA